MPSKIAILIDAENISYKDLQQILEEIPRHGEVVLRAVYGDWQRPALQKWHDIAAENNFKIRYQNSTFRTKNSSDIKLMMDAMEVLLRTPVEIFCLVTNDADYAPLCNKIHEHKKTVIGVGYQHASEIFVRACDQFIFIEREESPTQPVVPSSTKAPNSSPKKPLTPKSTDPLVVQKLLSKAFARAPQDAHKWVSLSALGSALLQVQAGFQTKSHGHANLSKLLQSMPDFVDLQTQDGVILARLKNNRPNLNTLQKLLSEAFAKVPQNTNGWVTLSALGLAILQVQPDFQSKSHGYTNLSKLLQSMPNFVELQTKDGVKSARLKN